MIRLIPTGVTIAANNILGVGEGAIAKRDRTSPQITLTLRQIRDLGGSGNNTSYELIFWIIPDKTIPTLYDTNSYQLIHVSDTDVRTAFFRHSRQGRRIRIPGRPDSFELSIRVLVRDSELESTKGFMLARFQDDDLLDIWGNPPVRAEDGALIGTGTDGLLRSTPAIIRLPSSDADLMSLEIASAGTNENIPLLPNGFSSAKTDYTAEVRGDRQILVTATATHPQATIQIAKGAIAENTPSFSDELASATIDLNLKTTTTVIIRVIAEDSITMKDYAIALTRLPNAQTEFVQSRFLGEPFSTVCALCDPADGIVHVRFKPEATKLINSSSANHVEFTLQIRKAGGIDLAIVVAQFRLAFDTAVFGENLNTPPVATGNNVNPAGQCSFVRAETFTMGTRNYSIFFGDSRPNELFINERSGFAFFNDVRFVTPASFAFFAEEWQDMVTMRCMIPSGMESSEAGFAVSGSLPQGFFGGRFPQDANGQFLESGNRVDRTMMLLVDNDLRGFRLDGKTWAEDYSRYGDGTGVRVKFSKGISTELAANNFVLELPLYATYSSTPTIYSVDHTAGSRYATIIFDRAVNEGVVRLISTTPTASIVMDMDNEVLADGSFVAALHYDAEAPVVMDVGQVNTATWSLTFDKPIHPAAVSKENLCLTNEMGVCADEVQGASITSVRLMGEDNKVLQVEISSAEQTERIAAIEFRRNAMLGADFRVVEEYQVELRDAITIADGVPPAITVEAMGAAMIQAQTHTTITYSMSFTVSANEAIADLGDVASYQLLLLPNSGESISINAVPSVTTRSHGSDNAIVSYTDIQVSVSDVRNSRGFTLARANSISLQDLSGKDPLESDSGFLDSRGVMDESAIALTGEIPDIIPPVIRVRQSETLPQTQNNKIYDVNFVIQSNENIPDIGNTASYKIVRCLNENCTTRDTTTYTPSNISSANPATGFSFARSISAEITLNNLEDIQATWGFVLLRASAGVLQDAAGNDPVNTNGQAIAADGILGVGEGAIARRDRTSPQISLRVRQVRRIDDSDTYELIFWVNSPAKTIPTLYEGASYRLIRVSDTNVRTDITDAATSFRIEQISIDGPDRVALTYRVTVSDSEFGSIKGFMVARAEADDLLDIWGNPPVRAEDGAPIGTGTDGLLRNTLAIIRLPETDATLETLMVAGELVAGFDLAIAEYTVEIEGNLAIDLIAKATHDQVMIQIAGISSVGQISTRTQLNLATTTTIAIEVTSEDRESTRAYTITVIRLPSKDASLTNIEIIDAESGQAVALLPAGFASTRTDYTAVVSDDLNVTINAEVMHPQATIQIAKGAIAENTPSFSDELASTTIDLNLKTTTTVVIRVIAEDSITMQDYTIALTRLPEADATLEALTIDGESVAGFDPAIAEYTVEVEGNLAIDLIAKATHDQVMIQIAGTSGVGQVSTRTQLNLATTTTIAIEVTSEDDANTRAYTITVIRLPSKDASLTNIEIIDAESGQAVALLPAGFASTRTDYTAVVSDDLNVTINAEVMHPQATVQIAKEAIAENTPSFSDELASATIDLNLKTTTTVVIRVIAEDGIMMQDYTIALTRLPEADATLEALTIDGESVAGFDPAKEEYRVEVEGNLAIDLIAKATHDQAMIQIAGTSGAGQVSTRTQLNLTTTTTIAIEVTSEDDANTRAYTIAIIRLPSADASLANIGIIDAESGQAVALLPAGFASTRTDYTAVVSDDLNVTINAEVMHPQATIQIAKEAIAENTPSFSNELASVTIDLNLKTTTTVVIRVTAEDSITMQDYTIALTRLPEADATLEALTIDGESVADFDPAIAEYRVEVEGNLAIDLIAKATHDQAGIQIAGTLGVGQVSTRTQLNLATTTTIAIEVTSEDDANTRAYTITVIRLPSADASLANIGIIDAESGQAVALLPAGFASTRTDYTAVVSDDLNVTINAEVMHPQATIQIAKEAIAENTPSFSNELASVTIDLNLKTTTTVVIRVIAEDSITMQDYTIALTRLPEADATLEALTIDGESVAGFDPAIAEYTVEVEGNLAIDLIAKATHDQAMIQIAGTSGAGQVSTRTQLNLATTTTIAIEVTSEDRESTRAYTITVIRLPSKDASLTNIEIIDAESGQAVALLPAGFASTRTDYTAVVSDDLNVTINAEVMHPQATVQIAKEAIAENTPSFSDELASATIDLNLKTTTTVVIRVIAEDGIMMQDYTIALTRLPEADATLEALTIDGESVAGFDPAKEEYRVEVEGNLAIDLIAKATHDQAMIQIAGTSGAGQVSTRTQLNLTTTTTIAIEVTSEDDANTRAYTIAIIRLPSADASLANIGIIDAESGQAVALLPAGFASTRTDYTAVVSDDLNVTINAEVMHPQATIQIAKEAIAENTPSFSNELASVTIDLNLKTTTTVVIRVTAEDSITMQDYTIALTRLPEADATLEALTIDGESVADFDPAIAEYRVEVEGNLAIDLIAKATHDQAGIQIAGTLGVGQVSTRTQLNLATTTTIAIEVTSEDDANTRAYTITVIRLPSADASLANIGIIDAESGQAVALLPAGFASTRTDYTAVVSDDLNVTINAEVMHPQATIQIAKEAIAENTPSFSNELASVTIDLNLKTTTTVVIRVIAEDSITMQDYTIALTRLPEADATLEALTIDGESVAGFDPAIAEYTVEVEGNLAIDLIAKATHDQAMIQIAGTSGAGQVSTRTQLNLATTTTIAIEVTSEDRESTRAYTITVIRLPSKDVDLMSLEIASAGTNENIPLLPSGFSSTKTDYTAEVRGDRQILVTATATHPQANIQVAIAEIVEATPILKSGETSAALELNQETTTTLVIRVIAEAGTPSQDYIVEISYVVGHIRIRTKIFLEGPLR